MSMTPPQVSHYAYIANDSINHEGLRAAQRYRGGGGGGRRGVSCAK